MGLVSGRSGLFSFQGTATRYLPFSYLRESFFLPRASLSSSVSKSLQSRSVPDFSISQNLFKLLSTSLQDSFPSLQIGSLQNKERITWDRVLAVSLSSGAPIQLYLSWIMEFRVINANQKIDKSIICRFRKIALGQMQPFILMVVPVHNSVIASNFLRTRFCAYFLWKPAIHTFDFNFYWHGLKCFDGVIEHINLNFSEWLLQSQSATASFWKVLYDIRCIVWDYFSSIRLHPHRDSS